MSDAFDQLEVKEEQLFASRDMVVSICRLVTRSRANGSVIDAPMAQVILAKCKRIIMFRPFYWNVPDYRAALTRT